ncbi:MAG: hypothetical protein ACLFSU_01715 [Acholeplasmataceae bacterium]
MTRTPLMIVILLLGLLLISCEEQDPYLEIIVPSGSPQLALAYVQDDPNYDVDVVQGPDGLLSAFTSRSHDAIVAPISLGAEIALGSDDYSLLSTITWGNLYLATTDRSVGGLDDLSGRELILFGQEQVPDLVVRHILDRNDIEADLTYVDSATTASSMMLSEEGSIAMVAEPSLSVLKAQHEDMIAIDLQQHYRSITGYDYPQAGIFIAKDLARSTVTAFQRDLKDSIESVNENPIESASLGVELGFDVDRDALAGAIPGSNIRYVSALDSKAAIERFLETFPLSSADKPSDEFYYD